MKDFFLEEFALKRLSSLFLTLNLPALEVQPYQKEISISITSKPYFNYHGCLWTPLKEPFFQSLEPLSIKLIDDVLSYKDPRNARSLMNQLEAEWRLISNLSHRMWFILELAYAHQCENPLQLIKLLPIDLTRLSHRPQEDILRAFLTPKTYTDRKRRERLIKKSAGLIKKGTGWLGLSTLAEIGNQAHLERACLRLYLARLSVTLHHTQSDLSVMIRYPLELPRERATLNQYRFKGTGLLALRCLQPELSIYQNQKPLLVSDGFVEISS